MKKSTNPENIALTEEFFQANQKLQMARDNFNNAEPEFFEIANKELDIAIEYQNLCAMKTKKAWSE